jgi:hypothetical protein
MSLVPPSAPERLPAASGDPFKDYIGKTLDELGEEAEEEEPPAVALDQTKAARLRRLTGPLLWVLLT